MRKRHHKQQRLRRRHGRTCAHFRFELEALLLLAGAGFHANALFLLLLLLFRFDLVLPPSKAIWEADSSFVSRNERDDSTSWLAPADGGAKRAVNTLAALGGGGAGNAPGFGGAATAAAAAATVAGATAPERGTAAAGTAAMEHVDERGRGAAYERVRHAHTCSGNSDTGRASWGKRG